MSPATTAVPLLYTRLMQKDYICNTCSNGCVTCATTGVQQLQQPCIACGSGYNHGEEGSQGSIHTLHAFHTFQGTVLDFRSLFYPMQEQPAAPAPACYSKQTCSVSVRIIRTNTLHDVHVCWVRCPCICYKCRAVQFACACYKCRAVHCEYTVYMCCVLHICLPAYVGK